MKKIIYKKNQSFGEWTLESYLGGGGNGEVWKSKNKKGEIGAIKLLKFIKKKSYERFQDETTVIENNSDVVGIIPIIEKFLPDFSKAIVPFYVMPVAVSSEDYFKGKNIVEKINAILEVSNTIKELHLRGISHRDIKPSNLLVYNSRCSLSDFGLVDYPNKRDVSFYNEEIGAKWTMAPEMRRESSKSDGKKADIYSLAKTLWIILTENKKGFDGQYFSESILGLRNFFKKIYTTPLDDLLTKCTDNDPNIRPDIIDFINSLEEWIYLNDDFYERNLEQWFEIQNKLFPTAFPKRVVWEKIDDIIKILKIICSYNSLNHMFYPDGGGMDLEDARISNEDGCIELDFGIIDIIKPKRLIFESFDYDPEWNYFRLELNELKPSIPHNIEDGEEPYEKRYDHEGVSEIYPAVYDKYEIVEYRSEYKELGYEIPDSARQVSRWFRGSFVIFNKSSVYNQTSSTYDGRHNKMSTEDFREYIQRNVDRFKEEEEKMSILEKIKFRKKNRRK